MKRTRIAVAEAAFDLLSAVAEFEAVAGEACESGVLADRELRRLCRVLRGLAAAKVFAAGFLDRHALPDGE